MWYFRSGVRCFFGFLHILRLNCQLFIFFRSGFFFHTIYRCNVQKMIFAHLIFAKWLLYRWQNHCILTNIRCFYSCFCRYFSPCFWFNIVVSEHFCNWSGSIQADMWSSNVGVRYLLHCTSISKCQQSRTKILKFVCRCRTTPSTCGRCAYFCSAINLN